MDAYDLGLFIVLANGILGLVVMADYLIRNRKM